MAQAATIRVEGYRNVMRAFAKADLETRRYVRATLAKSGQAVAHDAQLRFTSYDPRSAAGYRTRVLQRGVIVGQSLRKTTGKRGDYGSLQMRKALIPALFERSAQTEQAFQHALDEVCDHFNNTKGA